MGVGWRVKGDISYSLKNAIALRYGFGHRRHLGTFFMCLKCIIIHCIAGKLLSHCFLLPACQNKGSLDPNSVHYSQVLLHLLTRFLLLFFCRKETGYLLKKGEHFTLSVEKPEVDLTPAMIQRCAVFNIKKPQPN